MGGAWAPERVARLWVPVLPSASGVTVGELFNSPEFVWLPMKWGKNVARIHML